VPNLPLAFADALGGGILILAGLSGKSIGQVMQGQVSVASFAPITSGGATGGTSTTPTPTAPTPPASGHYTYTDLKNLWVSAGGNAASAPMAAAIAMAESGGDPNATNHNTNGSTDRGLWQINSVHGSQSTYNVADNVKAAIAISNNGSSWAPWSTFINGAYRQYLSG